MKKLFSLGIAFLIMAFMLIPQTFAYSDIYDDYEFMVAVENLTEANVLEGYDDGMFKPHQDVTRAEFMKIALKANDIEGSGENCFKDVQKQWFAPYVCKGKTLEINGYANDYFKPNKPINFAETSKVLVQVFNIEVDENAGLIWYEPYVYALEARGVIPGSISSFAQNVTRGEMTEMIWRLREGISDLPSKTFEDIKLNKTIYSLENALPANAQAVFELKMDNETQIQYLLDTFSQNPEFDEFVEELEYAYDQELGEHLADNITYNSHVKPILEGDWRIAFGFYNLDIDNPDSVRDDLEIVAVAEFEEYEKMRTLLQVSGDIEGADEVIYSFENGLDYWIVDDEIYSIRLGDKFVFASSPEARDLALENLREGSGFKFSDIEYSKYVNDDQIFRFYLKDDGFEFIPFFEQILFEESLFLQGSGADSAFGALSFDEEALNYSLYSFDVNSKLHPILEFIETRESTLETVVKVWAAID